ncbi:MAG TPA: hypothetical protein VK178_11130 [Opitutaceae bacterium]|nr:hypothetical protein [Opitutaceae bacterium]
MRRAAAQTAFAVEEARPAMGFQGEYEILIKFTDESGRRFAELTEATVGRSLGIVIDGELYSAPRVNERVSGGSAQITGTFSQREAIELSERLASALPLAAEATLENPDGSPVAARD